MGILIVSVAHMLHTLADFTLLCCSYGQEGNTLMFEFMMKIIDSGDLAFQWKNWSPINDQRFAVYNVMIPELLLQLVQQDTRGSREDAIKVVKESKEYGELGNSRPSK